MQISSFNNPGINQDFNNFQNDSFLNQGFNKVGSEIIEETTLDKLSFAVDKNFTSIMTPFIIEISRKYLSQDKIKQLEQCIKALPSFNNVLMPEGILGSFDVRSKEQINKLLELLKLDDTGSRLSETQSIFLELINNNINKSYIQKEYKSNYISSALVKTAFSYYMPDMLKIPAIKLMASRILDKIEPASVYWVPINYSASVVLENNTRKNVDTIIEILVPILCKIDEEYEIQKIYETNEEIKYRIAAIEPSDEEAGIQDVKKLVNEMFIKIYSSFHQPLNRVINTAISGR